MTRSGNFGLDGSAAGNYTLNGQPPVLARITQPETQPSASINYLTEKLTGLVAGAIYTVNGTQITASAAGEIDIDAAWMNNTAAAIVKVGNGTTTTNSPAQNLTIPARPAAPAGLAGVAPTTIGGANGSVTGTTAAMEYSVAGADAWSGCAAASTLVGAAGNYEVRVKAVAGGSFRSTVTVVTVPEFIPVYGDVNGDGFVNLLDLLVLTQHINGWTVTLSPGADVNGDGNIGNLLDLLVLTQYFNGWPVTLGP